MKILFSAWHRKTLDNHEKPYLKKKERKNDAKKKMKTVGMKVEVILNINVSMLSLDKTTLIHVTLFAT